MKHTVKYIVISFLALVIIDTAEFEFKFSKQKYGIFESAIVIVNYAKRAYKLFL